MYQYVDAGFQPDKSRLLVRMTTTYATIRQVRGGENLPEQVTSLIVTVTGALRLVPLMVTLSPVTPLVGLTDVMVGRPVLDTVTAPADVTASPSVVTTTSTVRAEDNEILKSCVYTYFLQTVR